MTIINPITLIIISLIATTIFILSLIYIFKNEEKPLFKILWTLFVIFLPVIGSLIYILKYFIDKKGKNHIYIL